MGSWIEELKGKSVVIFDESSYADRIGNKLVRDFEMEYDPTIGSIVDIPNGNYDYAIIHLSTREQTEKIKTALAGSPRTQFILLSPRVSNVVVEDIIFRLKSHNLPIAIKDHDILGTVGEIVQAMVDSLNRQRPAQ